MDPHRLAEARRLAYHGVIATRLDDAILERASDVLGAIDAGAGGCLVRTGKYRSGDEDRLPEQALVVDDLAALADRLLDGAS